MQGEFRGDFSRDTFDSSKLFSRVLMQQGRVLLDADWNEQTSILLHYLRMLMVDLVGPHGGPDRRPRDEDDIPTNTFPMDFELKPLNPANFTIGRGHYYVNGLLCENNGPDEPPLDYNGLPYTQTLTNNRRHLVYLDVWERHVTALDDDDLREKALNGPDTATRAKVVWQVRQVSQFWDGTNWSDIPTSPGAGVSWRTWVEHPDRWNRWLENWQPANRGQLKALGKQAPATSNEPCAISPDARYRGAENQLYRIEIHQGGSLARGDKPTFKWARDNSAIEFPILSLATSGSNTRVTLEHMGRDDRSGLHEGDWVEILDDEALLRNQPDNLLEVTAIDRVTAEVTLAGQTTYSVGDGPHARLRRWDHKAGDEKLGGLTLEKGAALIREVSVGKPNWLLLEDGVQIQFQPGATYRTGDYWLIPARTATGDVEWPGDVGSPLALPPHGVQHYFAPLAMVALDGAGSVTIHDCRRLWKPLGE
jgi:hypothetical protein